MEYFYEVFNEKVSGYFHTKKTSYLKRNFKENANKNIKLFKYFIEIIYEEIQVFKQFVS